MQTPGCVMEASGSGRTCSFEQGRSSHALFNRSLQAAEGFGRVSFCSDANIIACLFTSRLNCFVFGEVMVYWMG